MSAYDHWKLNDLEGERRQAEADSDWEAFEEWSQGVDDTVFSEWCRCFFDSLKPGTVLSESGWKCFEVWLYEKRWPAVRQRLAGMKYEPQDAEWVNSHIRKKAAEALNDGDVMEVGRLLAASMRANRDERLELDSLGRIDFDKPEGFA